MAICMIFTPPRDLFTDETYDKVLAHLGDGFPPASMRAHYKGKTENGEVRIVDVFDSAEDFQKFAETHVPAYEALGIKLDDILKNATIFEIEKQIQK